MGKNIRELLGDEIVREIKALEGIDPGKDGYAEAVDGIAKLYKIRNDESKILDEARGNDLKRSEESRRHYLTLGVEAMGIILPLIFYGSWMRKGLEFEKEGTFTSSTFKGLINRFRPTK